MPGSHVEMIAVPEMVGRHRCTCAGASAVEGTHARVKRLGRGVVVPVTVPPCASTMSLAMAVPALLARMSLPPCQLR